MTTDPQLFFGALPDRSVQATITATSEADATHSPASFLKTENLAERWMSADANELNTILDVTYSAVEGYEIGCIGPVLGNFSQTARIRTQVSDSLTGIPARVRMPPTASPEATNFTGGFGQVDDDPESPDAAAMVSTTVDFEASARFTFDTPASLAGTEGAQSFRALVRVVDDGAQPCDIFLYLYENGVEVRLLRQVRLLDDDGEFDQDIMILGHFSTSELASPDGSDVELRLVMQRSSGTRQIKAVDWWTSPAPPGGGAYTYDTGFVDAWPAITQQLLGEIHPYEHWAASGLSVPVYLKDSGSSFANLASIKKARIEIHDPDNPDGVVSIARLPSGPFISLPLRRGVEVSPVSNSERINSASDVDIFRHRIPRLGLSLPLTYLSEQVAVDNLLRFLGRVSHLRPFFVSPLPARPERQIDFSFYGFQRQAFRLIDARPMQPNNWSAQVQLTEMR